MWASQGLIGFIAFTIRRLLILGVCHMLPSYLPFQKWKGFFMLDIYSEILIKYIIKEVNMVVYVSIVLAGLLLVWSVLTKNQRNLRVMAVIGMASLLIFSVLNLWN